MSDFKELNQGLVVEQIEEAIQKYILDNALSAGMKIPSEHELAKKYNVSRGTVREAVKALVSYGILETRRGSGTYVLDSVSSKMDPLNLRNIEDKAQLAMDLVDLRMILEPGIAALAAQNASEEEIQSVMAYCDRVEYKIHAGSDYVRDDILFHTAIAKCTHNKVIEQVVYIIETAVLMFVNITHKKLTSETIMTHRQIAEAIQKHDAIGARSAMTMHIAFNRNMIIKLTQK